MLMMNVLNFPKGFYLEPFLFRNLENLNLVLPQMTLSQSRILNHLTKSLL